MYRSIRYPFVFVPWTSSVDCMLEESVCDQIQSITLYVDYVESRRDKFVG